MNAPKGSTLEEKVVPEFRQHQSFLIIQNKTVTVY